MGRTRRPLIDIGSGQFEDRGESWGDDFIVDFGDSLFREGFFFGPGAFSSVTIWRNGLISIGTPTAEQIAFVGSYSAAQDVHDFPPGSFVSAGYLPMTSVEITDGLVDFNEDEGAFDLANAVDVKRITWKLDGAPVLQIYFTSDDFTIAEPVNFLPELEIGYRVGSFTSRGDSLPVAIQFDSVLGLIIPGTDQADQLDGSSYADTITGMSGDDRITAGAGNDYVEGGDGRDTISGGIGNDTIIGGSGDDIIDGGDGIDEAVYAGVFSQATISFDGAFCIVETTAEDADRLLDVEFLRFADGLRSVAQLRTIDTIAPSLTSLTPANAATGVSLTSNIMLAFSEAVVAGRGEIRLETSAGVLVEAFDVASSARVTVSGTTLVIDPVSDLVDGAFYVVRAGAGIVTDVAGNMFAGIGNYGFTTGPGVPVGIDFQLRTSSGFAGVIGGQGRVFGNSGYQSITIVDQPGRILLDASFNRGGDLIRLEDAAGDYTVRRNGSSAELSDGDTTVVIPIGTIGIDVMFADGLRTLLFDAELGQPQIGTHSFGEQATRIVSPVNAPFSNAVPDAAAVASLVLADATPVVVGGNVLVFGNRSAQDVRIANAPAVVRLDASFNLGSDTVRLSGDADDWMARLSGSSVVLERGGTSVSIPAGTAGLTLDFADDDRTLRIDTTLGKVVIDGQIITVASAPLTPGMSALLAGPDSSTMVLSLG